jgi:hypothetical protein
VSVVLDLPITKHPNTECCKSCGARRGCDCAELQVAYRHLNAAAAIFRKLGRKQPESAVRADRLKGLRERFGLPPEGRT